MRIRTLVSAALGITLLSGLLAGSLAMRVPGSQAAGPVVVGLTPSAGSVSLYDKFELTFDIANTVATNLQVPYDPSPPAGIAGGIGISVEGQFLPPGATDWAVALRQPGFLYQGYDRQLVGSDEWLYPSGNPVWKIRFAPQAQGTWQYRVRVQDASTCSGGGSPCTQWTESASGAFLVLPPRPGQHGFVAVSESDPRYFVFPDGKLFAGLGHGSSFSLRGFTYDADQQFEKYAANGVDFVRVWMTGSGIVGSAWGPWVWFGGPGYGGYLQDPGLAIAPSGSGHDFTFNLSQQAGRLCVFNGWSQGPVAVKPSTTYRLAVTAQVSGVTGPRNVSNPKYGLTAKLGAWPSSCPDGITSYPSAVTHLQNTDWTTTSGTITTGASQRFLDYLFLALDNVSTGEANISQVSLREVLSTNPAEVLGPELLAKGSSDAHMDYSQPRSWDWDYVLDQAAEHGVFLKLVVLEKNDRIWNSIAADGTLTATGDNNNFYAAPNTKVRRLQEYYWRYLAARWGYSTAVHSWELANEGDPFNGNYHEQANSFARFMHESEPSRHLVTTSLWHSFPVTELWGNPLYQDLDYADLHAYISTGLGTYEWSAPSGTTLEADPALTYQGSAGAIRIPAGTTSGSKGVPIRGQGDWTIAVMVKAQGITGACPFGASASLAGPQLLVGLDSPNTRVIPYDAQSPNSYWTCTSPAGTYGYTKVQGVLPVADDNWHTLNLTFRTSFATSGTAWFDNLTITSPDGRVARIYGSGSFDDRERLDYDTALDGARSVSGAGKPIVRGEGGLNIPTTTDIEMPEVASDVNGVWLHNLLWGTLNSGGLYELYWYTGNIVAHNLYFQYKPVSDFLSNLPLSNGRYRDAQAVAEDAAVAVVGQTDRTGGRAHLWIYNRSHTWWNVVNGGAWGRLSGTVVAPGFAPNQTYAVEWWQFDHAGALTTRQEALTADASGNLTLSLASLPSTATDAAVKIGDYRRAFGRELAPIVR